MEDEPFLIEMYKARFTQEGYKVLAVNNGTPVFDMVVKYTPDLILLDIVMPEKDGYQVLRELKNSPKLKHIPILVFSNLGQDEEVKKGLRLGADDYFIKSNYTPTELVAKVEKMIADSQSGPLGRAVSNAQPGKAARKKKTSQRAKKR